MSEFSNVIPMPSVYFTQYRWIVRLLTFLLQTIPAYIADIYLWIRRRQTKFTKIQAKIFVVHETFEYVISNKWLIYATKTKALAESLSAESLSSSDKHDFPCDPARIDWDKYFPTYCRGIRQYLC